MPALGNDARRYGYDLARWRQAKEEVRAILVERAKRESNPTIFYSDLGAQTRAITFQPDSHAFHALLGEISSEEFDSGRGMLSVLVVSKDNLKPGPGFFELARRLGIEEPDTDRVWIDQFNHVVTFWRTHPDMPA